MGDRPLVRSAKVYLLSGDLMQEQLEKIKAYVINPVESREASLDLSKILQMQVEVPTSVPILKGFLDLDPCGLKRFLSTYELAMDVEDLAFCQTYFQQEGRNPTMTEIRMIDTYWS
ncbi:MAG TPA: phosphoribosylformylglycinamidine synthase, partial [Clostridiales bacterium]|nr:phosphoribosylformylglycinamidine synthase [Clostridiales bacterium]